MAHSAEIRAAVRAAVVHEGLHPKEAARRLGVPARTVEQWMRRARREGDDWLRARTLSYMHGKGSDQVLMSVLESIVNLTQKTLADIQVADIPPLDRVEAISRLVDAYHKTAAAVAKNSPRLNRLALAMEILEKLADYVVASHPKHAPALLEVLEPFGQEIAKAYG